MKNLGILVVAFAALLLVGCTGNVNVSNTSISQDQTKVVACQKQLDVCITQCNTLPNDKEVCKTNCQTTYTTCVT